MIKFPHKYIKKGTFPVNSIAWIIKIDNEKYGYYDQDFPENQLFSRLRGLVMEKHKLLEALNE